MKLAPCLFLLGIAVGTCAAESRIEAVDDPVQLAALGFAPDATDVWRRVDDADPETRPMRDIDGIIPPTHAYSIIGDDFQMTSSASDYSTGGNGALSCPTGQSVRIASATVRVPDGKRLAYIDMWGSDASPTENITASLFATCQLSGGAGNPSNIILASVQSSGAPGNYFNFATIPEHYVDTERCAYTINLQLGSGICQGADLRSYKVRVIWE